MSRYYRKALHLAPSRVEMMCPFALFLRTQGKGAEARQVLKLLGGCVGGWVGGWGGCGCMCVCVCVCVCKCV